MVNEENLQHTPALFSTNLPWHSWTHHWASEDDRLLNGLWLLLGWTSIFALSHFRLAAILDKMTWWVKHYLEIQIFSIFRTHPDSEYQDIVCFGTTVVHCSSGTISSSFRWRKRQKALKRQHFRSHAGSLNNGCQKIFSSSPPQGQCTRSILNQIRYLV